MLVIVGSTNSCKVAAVKETLAEYSALADAEVVACQAPSQVADQPRSQEETLRGAINRAKAAHATAEGPALAFGIESGVFEVGGTMFDNCACVAYDGSQLFPGWSGAFAIPPLVAHHVREGSDLTQASNQAAVSADANLGEGVGLIGVLSRGRVDRLAYTKQAIQMALIPALERTEYDRAAPAGEARAAQGVVAAGGLAVEDLVGEIRAQIAGQRRDFEQALAAQARQHAEQTAELRAFCEKLLKQLPSERAQD